MRAFGWWISAVPPRVAQNARPVSFHKGVLTVHAATSAWVSDLSFLEKQLLEALRARVPEAGVRSLRIRVGPLPPNTAPGGHHRTADRGDYDHPFPT